MADKELARELSRLASIVERMTLPVPAIPAIPAIAPIAPIIHTNDHDTIVELASDMKTVKGQISDISEKLDNKYTTKEEHKVVVAIQVDHESRLRIQEELQKNQGVTSLTTKIVFGTVTIILVAVLSGLVFLVVKQ